MSMLIIQLNTHDIVVCDKLATFGFKAIDSSGNLKESDIHKSS